jgi:hypothetical protein
MRAAFGYVLAVAAARHGVGVVAGVVMSNHEHLVVWDRDGRLPEFMRDLNQLTAKVVNATRGRWGEVWDGDQPHVMPLLGTGAILDACAYVLGNPVKAGLVERGREWPGFRTTPNGIGQREEFRRPEAFFSRAGDMPEVATLELVAPPGTDTSAFARGLAGRVERVEAAAREAVRAAGRRFAGVRRVLAASWRDSALSAESRREPKPKVATADAATAVAYLGWLAEFRAAYWAALERYLAGERGVLFPLGTYLMRWRFRVRCRRPPK